jgi:uncharacterized protein (DUF2147 family)
MSRALSLIAVFAAMVAIAPVASAQELTPVGRWVTVDDNTGKDRSVVTLTEKDGVVFGHIEKLILDPSEDPNPKCDKCSDAKKDQPVIGLEILWGLKKDGNEWSGGKILDPDNGKTYKCWIQVIDEGRRMKVRGFIGISLLGRTQYWKKAKE